jgi:hypothetical protein
MPISKFIKLKTTEGNDLIVNSEMIVYVMSNPKGSTVKVSSFSQTHIFNVTDSLDKIHGLIS